MRVSYRKTKYGSSLLLPQGRFFDENEFSRRQISYFRPTTPVTTEAFDALLMKRGVANHDALDSSSFLSNVQSSLEAR